ncbi:MULTISPECIES: DNA repair protein RecO [unclassified Haematospirillum]|uniref:DNA repair protein RecO n=1 Tax=unclassified Haematospirillum TaxID=2622088 RepID=UPI00143AA3F7|nr:MULTISPECIES: DNA repair protein RecO [unclassified Haematospirillum]NKD54214.1 DNA repair protein RecO [Haematospirillum sp. H4890]NKD74259.1 DNA repair protein RecO [Haematospirillum sp. H4485]
MAVAWQDIGVVLSIHPVGEGRVRLSVLTAMHGRWNGLVMSSRLVRKGGVGGLQPSNIVQLSWKARLGEQLGIFEVELLESIAPHFFDQPIALEALASACAVLDTVVPERQPYPDIWAALLALLAALRECRRIDVYVRWEVKVLAGLGYGLDLSCCAATGSTSNLIYVSPKTGRAVSALAGEPYRDRLLALPSFLVDPDEDADPSDLLQGLNLTGYFLEKHLLVPSRACLPSVRQRLAQRFLSRP